MPTKRDLILAGAGALAAAGAARAQAPEVETIRLWPRGVPGGERPAGLRQEDRFTDMPGGRRDRGIVGVVDPVLQIWRPAGPVRGAMLIVPGGGYRQVVIDKEGIELAERLVREGFVAGVLTYRLPAEDWKMGIGVARQDMQRAMRLMRRAVGPSAKLGAMGFSAGGDMVGRLGVDFTRPTYGAVDTADDASARPDYQVLVYASLGVQPRNPDGTRPPPSPGFADIPSLVSAQTPPAFIVHALDDERVSFDNATEMTAALKARGVPVETLLFEEGGHGFALRRPPEMPVSRWLDLFLAWGRRKGFVG
jgi:acetyl esterase/lipase